MNSVSASVAEIEQSIEASIQVKKQILAEGTIAAQLHELTQICIASLKAGNKLIFAGNGGSFADAQHLSAEFTSRFQFDRAPLSSIALATNNSAISAIGNDYGYEQVFARELQAVARPGDVYIPISTSGNSANIIASIRVALEMGVKTVCLTGRTGGQARELCECICIPSTVTAHIQECHIMLGHILCGLIENLIFRAGSPAMGGVG